MRKKRCERHRIFGILMIILLLFGGKSYASGYHTKDFRVNVKVNRDHSYEVSEEITVDFFSVRHGIFRDIPYQLGRTVIKDIYVTGQEFKIRHQHQDGKSVVRIVIGDKDRTLTGEWTYHIRYRVVSTRGKQEGADEIYLNLLPTFWESQIDSASCMLTMPEEIDWNNVNFFSGGYGSKGLSDKFHISTEKDFLLVEAEKLNKGEGFTMKGRLPEGFWQGEFDRRDHDWAYFAGIGFLTAMIVLLWFFFGRDPKLVPTVEVLPPENLTPLDVGYLIDGHMSNQDILSMIPYFAQKNYLRIERGESGTTIFQRLVSSEELKESPAVVEVFKGLFPDGSDRFDTGDTDSSKAWELSRLRKQHFDLAKGLLKIDHEVGNLMYTGASKKARRTGLILLGLLVLFVIFYVSWVVGGFPDKIWLLVPLFPTLGAHILVEAVERRHSRTWFEQVFFGGMAIGILILSYFAVRRFLNLFYTTSVLPGIWIAFVIGLFFEMNMLARTEESQQMMGKLLGFKEFIRVAELDRIRMLVNEHPNYFYDVLPYAYVFGLTKEWMRHFEALNVEKPDWYRDPMNPYFDFEDITSSMNAVSSSLSTSDSDYDSDSGGFSGGGDGGGGGGAW